MRKFNLTAATLAVAMISFVPLAHAAPIMTQLSSGGAGTVCPGGGPLLGFTAMCTLFLIPTTTVIVNGFESVSNAPGTAANASLFGSTLEIINQGSTVVPSAFLWLGTSNFTMPVGPNIVFHSEVAGTATTGTGTVTLTSCVDTNNSGNDLPPPTDAFCIAGPSLMGGYSFAGPDSEANTQMMTIPSLSGPYSLMQAIHLTNISPGASFNVNTSAILTAVPDPASTLLLGSGLLVVGALIRKRGARRS